MSIEETVTHKEYEAIKAAVIIEQRLNNLITKLLALGNNTLMSTRLANIVYFGKP